MTPATSPHLCQEIALICNISASLPNTLLLWDLYGSQFFPLTRGFLLFPTFWFFTCQGQVPEQPVLRLGDFCATSSDRELLAQLGGILRINLLSSSLPPPWDKPLSVAVLANFLPRSNSQSSAYPLVGWGDRNQWEALVGLTHLFI